MRNLRNNHRSLFQSPPGAELTACAWDVAVDSSIICAFGPTKDNTLLELKRWKKHEKTLQPIASWDAQCPLPDLDYDEILDLHYFPDSSTACLVLAGGDIVVVREELQPGEEKIEIVGSVDAGISAAAWSPDEELLAINTRAETLLYMTRDFENVTDITLTSEDLKASNHVSVGWGKKETQFKGKKARALRDPTMPETVDEGILSEYDANETIISWRGDGAYLAMNSIESDLRRVIRVYSRDGVLDSVSEPVDGLVGALSWRLAGNILAGVQYRDNNAKVVFFERNGLRHGQFDLRLSEEEIKDWGSKISLKWNVDSSVLSVCFRDRVQLWTMSNYHYYLKQEILALPEDPLGRPVSLKWHSEKPLHFILGSRVGVQRFIYASVVSDGPTQGPEDYGVVAVIDGKCLKVTPMRLANIPPPMALHEIALESNAIDVVITTNLHGSKSLMIAVLHHTGCSLFEWPLGSMMQQPFHKRTMNPIQKIFAGFMYLKVAFSGVWTVTGFLLLLSSNVESSMLWIIDRDGRPVGEFSSHGQAIEGIITNSPSLNSAKFTNGISSDSLIFTISPSSDRPASTNDSNSDRLTFLAIDDNKHVRREELDSDISHFNERSELKLAIAPFASSRIMAIRTLRVEPHPRSRGVPPITPGFMTPQGNRIFSLTDNGSLLVDERRLVKNCTSFLVTPAHLIFTTSQHLLKFVHMTDCLEDLEVPPDTPESDERCRSIERGAKLVTVMPSIFALVLQMPRGNLETIYPRALVLAGIRDSINRRKYKKAFLACRNQRVDMNFLHDHAPEQFVSNVESFLDQVQKVEHIDLFLSQLRDENVSKTMYRETSPGQSLEEALSQPAQPGNDTSESKVNRICNAFLDTLKSRTSTHFQNVVTAHVCKKPPDLDAGLAQIAGLRSKNPDLVERAIEHICFLADVNRLFDNALGLYDLELALLIAQQSQKDPKEYLPFLQNLQREPLLRRQYSVDNFLGRFQKALKHLCDLNAFDEVKAYIVKHSLYTEALDYYRYQEEKLKDIMRIHADHLQQIGKFKEAGIAYEYLTDYPSASESYRQAHLWKESLTCATLIPLPDPQLHSLAQTLADTLSESKIFSSAATIHLSYLSDIPAAARLFCKGYFFADALRIIGLHHRPDLLDTVIDVGLIEGMATMIDLLADCKSQLLAQVPRIRELRAKKAEDPLAFFEGDGNEGADVPDNVSVAPTDASTAGGDGTLFTRYTNRTGTVGTNASRRSSKNRRREERKKARGKKGSIYEEEYLVNSVGRLVERVNAVGGEVERLVVGLMRRGMRERAAAVEGAMVEVVGMCRGCLGEVFGEGGKEADGKRGGEGDEEGRPRGGEGVMWDTLEGEKRREVPMVNDFARLSLLGR